jgi:hypothetical protein
MHAAPTLRCRTLVVGLLLTLAPALVWAADGNPPGRLPTGTVTGKVDGLRLGDIAWLRRDSFGLDSATLARYRESSTNSLPATTTTCRPRLPCRSTT